MKTGMAIEGYIREDGTVRPLEHYDDTELRAKIQTNTDRIDNNVSAIADHEDRISTLEQHGGAPDPMKADKVVDATAGHLASLDEEGNLQDSGHEVEDFAAVNHTHSGYAAANHVHNGIQYNTTPQEEGEGDPGIAAIGVQPYADGIQGCVVITLKKQGQQDSKVLNIPYDALDYLANLIAGPQAPTSGGDRYPTSGQVYAALQALEGEMSKDGAELSVETDAQDNKFFRMRVPNGLEAPVEVLFTKDNLPNLNRSLQVPVIPMLNSTAPITSGQVYEALEKKSSLKSAMNSPKASIELVDEDDSGNGVITFVLTDNGVRKTATIAKNRINNVKGLIEGTGNIIYVNDPSTTIDSQTSGNIKTALLYPEGVYHNIFVNIFDGTNSGVVPAVFRWVKDSAHVLFNLYFGNVWLNTSADIPDDDVSKADFIGAAWTRRQIGQNIYF